MPKRKKYPRLPSGFGSIRYLGKGRSAPYAVHPPCTQRDENGLYIRPKPICYVSDWYTGFSVLTAWHAGTYTPGLENTISLEADTSIDIDMFCRRMLKNVSIITGDHSVPETLPTFEDVYQMWYEWKFGEHAAKKLSRSTRDVSRAAFALLPQFHQRAFSSLTLTELQEAVNSIQKSSSSIAHILSLLKQLYRFAVPRELCEKDLGQYVVMPSAPDHEHHEPFSDEDLKVMWRHRDNEIIKRVLIMCYSGFRVSAYETILTNMEDWYFQGGIKTASSRNRIVPIHSGIRDLVRDVAGDYMCGKSVDTFRRDMVGQLQLIELEPRTPHSCRHTFSRLCESYGVNEADRKRMMGHSFGSDITNAVYGHRTLEELREQIEKIQVDSTAE